MRRCLCAGKRKDEKYNDSVGLLKLHTLGRKQSEEVIGRRGVEVVNLEGSIQGKSETHRGTVE